MVSGDAYGRSFFLRVPDVTAIDNTVAALYQLGNPNPPEQPVGGGGFWLGNPSDGVTAQNVTYLEHVNATSLGLYQAVVDAVNAIIGTGIRWTMIADPNLTA